MLVTVELIQVNGVVAGDDRWAARGWAAAGLLLSLATTLMLVYVSYVHRDLETAMSGKDTGGAPAGMAPDAPRWGCA